MTPITLEALTAFVTELEDAIPGTYLFHMHENKSLFYSNVYDVFIIKQYDVFNLETKDSQEAVEKYNEL